MLKRMKPGSAIKYRRTSLLLVIACFALCGFGLWGYKAILKNAKGPFVELSGSVGVAIGNAQTQEMNEEQAQIIQTPKPTPKPTPIPKPTPLPKPSEKESDKKSNIVEIEISGDIIKKNGTPCRLSDIELLTRNASKSFGKEIIIVDDWADYTVYRKVMSMLDEAGLNYEKKTNEE